MGTISPRALVEWKWVAFECHADRGSEVFVAGTFNNWKPSRAEQLRDRQHDGTYRTLLRLRKGQHQYKFVVNGAPMTNARHAPITYVRDVA